MAPRWVGLGVGRIGPGRARVEPPGNTCVPVASGLGIRGRPIAVDGSHGRRSGSRDTGTLCGTRPIFSLLRTPLASGLVVFAGEPHTVAPLRRQGRVATVKLLLQPLTPGLMPESGDKLAPALDEAQRLLTAGYAQHGHVVVFSDGFADPADALLTAQHLRQQGTSVDVIGVGTQAGAPEPDGKGGFVNDSDGRPRLTRIQTDELQHLAAAGGGKFVPVGGLHELSGSLQSDESDNTDARTEVAQAHLEQWRNEGVWLLPPLLLLAALLARRGWV